MFRPMKPETASRRAKQHAQEQVERKARLVAALRAKVDETGGANSIWVELLAEAEARQ